MKTKITVTILLITAFVNNVLAQYSYKPEPANTLDVMKSAVQVLTHTEKFFGTDLKVIPGKEKLTKATPYASVESYISSTETFFGADFSYSDKGAMITNIVPYSPAESYNFRRADIITAIGSIVINSENSFKEAMASNKPGELVNVYFTRKGIQKQRKVKLEKITVYKEAVTN